MSTSTGRERRKAPRYPIRVPLSLRVRGEIDERLRVGDLSDGGLSFTCPRPLPEGVTVEVALPVADERFTITGSVVCCRSDAAAGSFRVGLAFREPAMRFRMKLAEQILRIHELRRELSREGDREVSTEEAAREWVNRYARDFADLYA